VKADYVAALWNIVHWDDVAERLASVRSLTIS
jgi:superoxide dismutase